MQDFGYQDDPAEASGGAVTRRFVNFTGALVSTALVIGMGVWGYKLMVRDVSGIPVIEAIDGAFRTQPEDPGGLQAPHQGLQVNEIAAGGTASDPADEVRLAPEPIDLAAEDAPMGELGPEDGEAEGAPAALAPLDEEGPAVTEAEPVAEDDAGGAPATDRAVAEAMAALSNGGDATAPEALIPRPAPRPGEDAPVQVSSAAPADSSRVGAGETAPEALAEGTRLVQLGAFESAKVAREHWGDVGARFADAFADKRMVVQEAMSGGKPFYRLRAAGFSDLAEAESFCSTLLAGRADCIPVEVR